MVTLADLLHREQAEKDGDCEDSAQYEQEPKGVGMRVKHCERVLPAGEDAREDGIANVTLGKGAQPLEEVIW